MSAPIMLNASPPEPLAPHWRQIRALARRSPVVPIATINADGAPHISPVGSFSLHRTEPRGLYLELFTRTMPRNLDRDARFTALLVDSGALFWLRSLMGGRFSRAVGVRLHGEASARRTATEKEVERFRKIVRPVKWTRGYDMLWSKLPYVRDLTFTAVTPIRLGQMSRDTELAANAVT